MKVGNNNGKLCIATPPRVAHARPPGPKGLIYFIFYLHIYLFIYYLQYGSGSGGSQGTPHLLSPWTNVTVASSVGLLAVSTLVIYRFPLRLGLTSGMLLGFFLFLLLLYFSFFELPCHPLDLQKGNFSSLYFLHPN